MTRRAHEVMGELGALEFLRDVAASDAAAHPLPTITDSMTRAGVLNPERLREEMLDAQVLQRIGNGYGPSTHGRRVAALLDAVNGGDIEVAIAALRRLSDLPRVYELIRNSVTTPFFASLYQRPGLQRLYICSPWIHLSPRQIAILKYALVRMQHLAPSPPEILVITLPESELNENQRGGVKPLLDMGAEVVCH